jgi:predicted Holliday junction resolvase-like endonuclease
MNYVTQLRRLQQDGTGTSGTNPDTFDSKYSDTNVFLYVNIIIVIILLFSIVFYCYIFRSRIDIFLRRQIDINEMNFEQNIRDRQQRRLDAAAEAALAATTQNAAQTPTTNSDEEESAESRRTRLLESFQRNKVTMVCIMIVPY